MSGSVCLARRVVCVLPLEGRPVVEQIEALHEPLTRCLEGMNAAGAPATVLTAMGELGVGVFSTGARAGAGAAASATLLALADLAQFTPDAALAFTAPLVLDESSTAARQRHILAGAITPGHADAIANLVSTLGLSLNRILPSDALALRLVVETVMQDRKSPAGGMLWIGRASSILACRSDGALKLVRVLGVGIDHLAGAFARALKASTPERGPHEVTLTVEEARTLLLTHGLPSPDALFDERRGIAGSAVLPLLQPVLQRLGVEIKQSLRFGVPEAQRASLVLTLDGPGAQIARLADFVTRQSGVNVAAGVTVGFSASPGAAPGSGVAPDITAWNMLGRTEAALLPSAVSEERMRRRVSSAMWIGVGAALILAAGSGLAAESALRRERAQLEAMAAGATLVSTLPRAEVERIVTSSAQVERERTRIAAALGQSADFGAALRAVSTITPESFKLSRIEVVEDERGASLLVVGLADADDELDFARQLKAFTGTLGSLPIIKSVNLGATGRVTASDGSPGRAHRFELKAGLVSLPRDAVGGTATARSMPAGAPPHPAAAATPAPATPLQAQASAEPSAKNPGANP